MTQYEKEMIAKIQIFQLVTDQPYRDDFYYQVYTSLRKANVVAPLASTTADGDGSGGSLTAIKSDLNWQQAMLVQQDSGTKGNTVSNQMQQQMQKLIEGRKQKTKNSARELFHFRFLFLFVVYFFV